jgi:hypothetical protein
MLFFWLMFPVSILCFPCAENEILLRNNTCHCPFFKYNNHCLRHRYQTTINTTVAQLYNSRHLLSDPMLLTIDATNAEAMNALAASVSGYGTVVTRIVDSMDTLVGGDASATLEIVNVTVVNNTFALVTADCRFPLVDFFFFYVHFGTSSPPCPPFDVSNKCCWGDMGSEFITTSVDCAANQPMQQMDKFVAAWGGRYVTDDRQMFQISIPLQSVPSTIQSGARLYNLGLGMVVFGKLAQNTESRIQLQLNSSAIATSFGSFQYSFVEYSRLQLEACGNLTFAHAVVKAANVTGVQNLQFQLWDGGDWIAPSNCSSTFNLGSLQLLGCNVSIDSAVVDVYVYLGPYKNKTTTLYMLLQRGNVLTRVVMKTDDSCIQLCNTPVAINSTGHNAFTIEVTQGSWLKYSGPPGLIQLSDVAALSMRIVSRSTVYNYSFDNISVVYSLIDSASILALMPEGKITPQLETLCDAGNVCLVEDLMRNGVCQAGEKCEVQGNSLFVMPLYPWGGATLRNGTYTVMVTEIKESIAQQTGVMRRLMNWLRGGR